MRLILANPFQPIGIIIYLGGRVFWTRTVLKRELEIDARAGVTGCQSPFLLGQSALSTQQSAVSRTGATRTYLNLKPAMGGIKERTRALN